MLFRPLQKSMTGGIRRKKVWGRNNVQFSGWWTVANELPWHGIRGDEEKKKKPSIAT